MKVMVGKVESVARGSVVGTFEFTKSVAGRVDKGKVESVAWMGMFIGAVCPVEQADSRVTIKNRNTLLFFIILFTFNLNDFSDFICEKFFPGGGKMNRTIGKLPDRDKIP